jgi:hypothetical protein
MVASASAPIARPAPPRGWLATFLVLAIMLGIVVGGFVAAASVASLPDKPVTIADGVTVTIPPEWSYGGRSDDGKAILLSRGNASVVVTVNEDSDEKTALEKVRNEWAALGTVTVGDIAPAPEARTDGKSAARFAYSGTFPDEGLPGAVEGEVTAVQGSNSVAVLFDAWAGEGEFPNARADVATIIHDTTIP